MDRNFRRKKPGRSNWRARPFVGWHHKITQLRQIRGVRVGLRRAKKNNGSTLSFPPILQLQTRTGCNASCVFCPQNKIKGMFPEASLSEDLYNEIVRQCVGEKDLYGIGFVLQNEPLLDPSIFEKIRYFREKVRTKAMTFLVTNGTLLTPDISSELLECGLDAIHISFNGYRKEDFEAVNREKSWDTFIENIYHFLSRDLSRISVMLSFVRSNVFSGELNRSIREWKKRGIQCFIHTVNNRGGLVENYDDYSLPLEKESLPIRIRKTLVKKIMGNCPYPYLQMSILANGQVLICTHDWSRKQIVGDLNHAGIEEIWNGEVMRDIRRIQMAGGYDQIPSCSNCDVFKNVTFG